VIKHSYSFIKHYISDHYLIYAVRKVGIPKGSPRFIETRNFKNYTKAKFIDDIKNTIWPSPNNEDNINIVWEEWKLKMLSILDKHAPCRTKIIRIKPSPWINSELKRELYTKDMLKKKSYQIKFTG
jgi:hypothetical protein